MYEDMVHRAERTLSENKRKYKAAMQSPEADAAALAEELFHTPGTLLTSEELGRMAIETECIPQRATPQCNFASVLRFRTIDGTCNNIENPLMGAAGTEFSRLIPGVYEDGISSPRGTLQFRKGDLINVGPFVPPNPSARLISETVILNVTDDEIPFTHILMQWGQFLDHDLDLAPEIEVECEGCELTPECAPIAVPDLDRSFGEGTKNNANCLPVRRSVISCETDTPGSFSPREQINDITSFIDGSMVYGSNKEQAQAVRAFKNGLLRTGRPFPANEETLPIDTEGLVACLNRTECFLCGEVRCNEQFSLTIMHTLWLREHNRCARSLRRINPSWNDERLFQECRLIIGALIEKITYEDYLPKVLGPRNFNIFIGPYTGYNPDVDASVPNSFATAAYRYGHSLVRPQFDRLDENYRALPIGPLNLVDAFFNPDQFRIGLGTDPIMRGWVNVNSRRMDEFVNSVLTTSLFRLNIPPGLDLASLNIQRGREHGLVPYPPWRNFCQRIFGITSNFENELTLVRFLQLYGSLETVDLWIGGLAEERLQDSLLGATFACIFGITFSNVRAGDRFFYLNPGVFTPAQLQQIQQRTLSRIICDNSANINQIQPDAFLSNQSRVNCNQLPTFDYNTFRDNECYFRAHVLPVNRQVVIQSFSRVGQGNFVNVPVTITESRQDTFVCASIQCPTREDTEIVTFNEVSSLNTLRITVNQLLPADVDNRPGIYRGTLTASQFRRRGDGLFTKLEECEASTKVSFTFDFSGVSQEEAASQEGNQEDKGPEIPEDFLRSVIKTRDNMEGGTKKEEEKESVLIEEMSDQLLLKELEDAMKSLKTS